MKNFIVVFSLIASLSAFAASPVDPDKDYDRLDGTGASGKKVNVIEWEGNLEVHVYPAGSLKGLALKLDKKNKAKPVMVIGYRFDDGAKNQLIRRAILGIDLKEGFKTFRDTSAEGYDKIIISNNTLSDQVVAYRLDPEPSQLYPEGHPALAAADPVPPASALKTDRLPAKAKSAPVPVDNDQTDAEELEETGTIKPFFMREGRSH